MNVIKLLQSLSNGSTLCLTYNEHILIVPIYSVGKYICYIKTVKYDPEVKMPIQKWWMRQKI